MQECTKNKQGKIGTNCQIGSFGTILVCTNYPMTIHNKVVHQLNPPSSIQHIKVLIEFHFLHKFCMETRCFLEKFTQLEKNLHNRWSRRSWQTSSLVVPLRRHVSPWLSWIYRDDIGVKISTNHLSPCKIYFIHLKIISSEFKIYVEMK